MKALLLEAEDRLSIKELPRPVPLEDEVLLKVSHCMICRTDAKMFKSGHRELIMPRIMGHEIAAADPVTGKRFAVWPGKSCGKCSLCEKGLENLCTEMKVTGFHRDGGFAEYISVPRASLVEVPEGLPAELVCFAELLASGINAVEQRETVSGESIMIAGAGTAGILAGTAFKSLSARVCIMEKNPMKIKKCAAISELSDIEIKNDFSDMSFDMALNAAPGLEAFAECVKKLRPGGCFYFFSGLSGESVIPVSLLNEIHYKQLKIYGVYGNKKKQMEKALSMISANSTFFYNLIERKLRLEEVPQVMDDVLSGTKFKYLVEL